MIRNTLKRTFGPVCLTAATLVVGATALQAATMTITQEFTFPTLTLSGLKTTLDGGPRSRNDTYQFGFTPFDPELGILTGAHIQVEERWVARVYAVNQGDGAAVNEATGGAESALRIGQSEVGTWDHESALSEVTFGVVSCVTTASPLNGNCSESDHQTASGAFELNFGEEQANALFSESAYEFGGSSVLGFSFTRHAEVLNGPGIAQTLFEGKGSSAVLTLFYSDPPPPPPPPAPVPLPASGLLLAAGLGGVFALRRRRAKAQD